MCSILISRTHTWLQVPSPAPVGVHVGSNHPCVSLISLSFSRPPLSLSQKNPCKKYPLVRINNNKKIACGQGSQIYPTIPTNACFWKTYAQRTKSRTRMVERLGLAHREKSQRKRIRKNREQISSSLGRACPSHPP